MTDKNDPVFQAGHVVGWDAHENLPRQEDTLEIDMSPTDDLLMMAWTIIANANGGIWEDADDEWVKAARKWRDDYHAYLDKSRPPDGALINHGASTTSDSFWWSPLATSDD